MLRVGIVAGEASGDLLGGELIKAIKARRPDAVFEGIAGPSMKAQGCHSLYAMEKLSVMGLVEVLGHYRELSAMRKTLAQHFITNPPDVFIGIDAPDFNLGLEAKLKGADITTIHYVSPSVWAWRQYRLRKIAGAVDLMLTLFPFEAKYYQEHHVPVKFVGHPLADMIPLQNDRDAARRALNLPEAAKIIALLPGSRGSEVERLAEPFIKAALWCQTKKSDLHFVVPLVNQKTRSIFEKVWSRYAPHLSLSLLDGQSRQAMAAADVVLTASGTATLEAMLLKKPMVVAYRLAPLTYWVAKRLVRINLFSLPNLLAGEKLVPEIIQNEVTAENLGRAVLDYLEHPDKVESLQQRFIEIHHALCLNASENAAASILELIDACQNKPLNVNAI